MGKLGSSSKLADTHPTVRILAVLISLVATWAVPAVAGTLDEGRVVAGETAFVALEEAVAEGEIDAATLGPSRAEALSRILALPPSSAGCIEVANELPSDAPGFGFEDVDAALRSSERVWVGRVVAVEPGFADRLGHVVTLTTDRMLRGTMPAITSIFVPKGEFEIGTESLCVNHLAYPELPSIGDRMVVMHSGQTASELLEVRSTQLIVLPRGGTPIMGRSIVASGPGSPRVAHIIQAAPQAIRWAEKVVRESDAAAGN